MSTFPAMLIFKRFVFILRGFYNLSGEEREGHGKNSKTGRQKEEKRGKEKETKKEKSEKDKRLNPPVLPKSQLP